MPFLTIFSAPKPFTQPHIATIQRNAIQSWAQLGPEVEVILVGEETGLAETSAEFGLRHLPQVARNEQGTPLVSSIFSLACQASASPVLAYLNADILVLPDFLSGARQVASQARDFLVIGQRWDLDVTAPLDFHPGWESRLVEDLQARGKLHPPAGSDYFIYPRHLFTEMPAFAIGRSGWDNWMIFHARQKGWPVVDGTASIRIVHQNHDYSHLPGGKPHYDLEESRRNIRMAGGERNMFTLLESDHVLRGGRIHRAPARLVHWLHRLELRLLPDEQQRSGPRWLLVRRLRRWQRILLKGAK